MNKKNSVSFAHYFDLLTTEIVAHAIYNDMILVLLKAKTNGSQHRLLSSE